MDQTLLHLTAMGAEAERCATFDFWQLPRRKLLAHDGACLRVRAVTTQHSFSLQLACALTAGDPFAYLLPPDGREKQSQRAIVEFSTCYRAAFRNEYCATTARPSRTTLHHVQILQAVDGVFAGASQRDIAIVLMGEQNVATEWSTDGALRAHVRALIARGKRMIDGGYRSLLDNNQQGAKP